MVEGRVRVTARSAARGNTQCLPGIGGSNADTFAVIGCQFAIYRLQGQSAWSVGGGQLRKAQSRRNGNGKAECGQQPFCSRLVKECALTADDQLRGAFLPEHLGYGEGV